MNKYCTINFFVIKLIIILTYLISINSLNNKYSAAFVDKFEFPYKSNNYEDSFNNELTNSYLIYMGIAYSNNLKMPKINYNIVSQKLMCYNGTPLQQNLILKGVLPTSNEQTDLKDHNVLCYDKFINKSDFYTLNYEIMINSLNDLYLVYRAYSKDQIQADIGFGYINDNNEFKILDNKIKINYKAESFNTITLRVSFNLSENEKVKITTVIIDSNNLPIINEFFYNTNSNTNKNYKIYLISYKNSNDNNKMLNHSVYPNYLLVYKIENNNISESNNCYSIHCISCDTKGYACNKLPFNAKTFSHYSNCPFGFEIEGIDLYKIKDSYIDNNKKNYIKTKNISFNATTSEYTSRFWFYSNLFNKEKTNTILLNVNNYMTFLITNDLSISSEPIIKCFYDDIDYPFEISSNLQDFSNFYKNAPSYTYKTITLINKENTFQWTYVQCSYHRRYRKVNFFTNQNNYSNNINEENLIINKYYKDFPYESIDYSFGKSSFDNQSQNIELSLKVINIKNLSSSFYMKAFALHNSYFPMEMNLSGYLLDSYKFYTLFMFVFGGEYDCQNTNTINKKNKNDFIIYDKITRNHKTYLVEDSSSIKHAYYSPTNISNLVFPTIGYYFEDTYFTKETRYISKDNILYKDEYLDVILSCNSLNRYNYKTKENDAFCNYSCINNMTLGPIINYLNNSNANKLCSNSCENAKVCPTEYHKTKDYIYSENMQCSSGYTMYNGICYENKRENVKKTGLYPKGFNISDNNKIPKIEITKFDDLTTYTFQVWIYINLKSYVNSDNKDEFFANKTIFSTEYYNIIFDTDGSNTILKDNIDNKNIEILNYNKSNLTWKRLLVSQKKDNIFHSFINIVSPAKYSLNTPAIANKPLKYIFFKNNQFDCFYSEFKIYSDEYDNILKLDPVYSLKLDLLSFSNNKVNCDICYGKSFLVNDINDVNTYYMPLSNYYSYDSFIDGSNNPSKVSKTDNLLVDVLESFSCYPNCLYCYGETKEECYECKYKRLKDYECLDISLLNNVGIYSYVVSKYSYNKNLEIDLSTNINQHETGDSLFMFIKLNKQFFFDNINLIRLNNSETNKPYIAIIANNIDNNYLNLLSYNVNNKLNFSYINESNSNVYDNSIENIWMPISISINTINKSDMENSCLIHFNVNNRLIESEYSSNATNSNICFRINYLTFYTGYTKYSISNITYYNNFIINPYALFKTKAYYSYNEISFMYEFQNVKVKSLHIPLRSNNMDCVNNHPNVINYDNTTPCEFDINIYLYYNKSNKEETSKEFFVDKTDNNPSYATNNCCTKNINCYKHNCLSDLIIINHNNYNVEYDSCVFDESNTKMAFYRNYSKSSELNIVCKYDNTINFLDYSNNEISFEVNPITKDNKHLVTLSYALDLRLKSDFYNYSFESFEAYIEWNNIIQITYKYFSNDDLLKITCSPYNSQELDNVYFLILPNKYNYILDIECSISYIDNKLYFKINDIQKEISFKKLLLDNNSYNTKTTNDYMFNIFFSNVNYNNKAIFNSFYANIKDLKLYSCYKCNNASFIYINFPGLQETENNKTIYKDIINNIKIELQLNNYNLINYTNKETYNKAFDYNYFSNKCFSLTKNSFINFNTIDTTIINGYCKKSYKLQPSFKNNPKSSFTDIITIDDLDLPYMQSFYIYFEFIINYKEESSNIILFKLFCYQLNKDIVVSIDTSGLINVDINNEFDINIEDNRITCNIDLNSWNKVYLFIYKTSQFTSSVFDYSENSNSFDNNMDYKTSVKLKVSNHNHKYTFSAYKVIKNNYSEESDAETSNEVVTYSKKCFIKYFVDNSQNITYIIKKFRISQINNNSEFSRNESIINHPEYINYNKPIIDIELTNIVEDKYVINYANNKLFEIKNINNSFISFVKTDQIENLNESLNNLSLCRAMLNDYSSRFYDYNQCYSNNNLLININNLASYKLDIDNNKANNLNNYITNNKVTNIIDFTFEYCSSSVDYSNLVYNELIRLSNFVIVYHKYFLELYIVNNNVDDNYIYKIKLKYSYIPLEVSCMGFSVKNIDNNNYNISFFFNDLYESNIVKKESINNTISLIPFNNIILSSNKFVNSNLLYSKSGFQKIYLIRMWDYSLNESEIIRLSNIPILNFTLDKFYFYYDYRYIINSFEKNNYYQYLIVDYNSIPNLKNRSENQESDNNINLKSFNLNANQLNNYNDYSYLSHKNNNYISGINYKNKDLIIHAQGNADLYINNNKNAKNKDSLEFSSFTLMIWVCLSPNMSDEFITYDPDGYSRFFEFIAVDYYDKYNIYKLSLDALYKQKKISFNIDTYKEEFNNIQAPNTASYLFNKWQLVIVVLSKSESYIKLIIESNYTKENLIIDQYNKYNNSSTINKFQLINFPTLNVSKLNINNKSTITNYNNKDIFNLEYNNLFNKISFKSLKFFKDSLNYSIISKYKYSYINSECLDYFLFSNLLLFNYNFGDSALLKDKDNYIIFNEVNPTNINITKNNSSSYFTFYIKENSFLSIDYAIDKNNYVEYLELCRQNESAYLDSILLVTKLYCVKSVNTNELLIAKPSINTKILSFKSKQKFTIISWIYFRSNKNTYDTQQFGIPFVIYNTNLNNNEIILIVNTIKSQNGINLYDIDLKILDNNSNNVNISNISFDRWNKLIIEYNISYKTLIKINSKLNSRKFNNNKNNDIYNYEIYLFYNDYNLYKYFYFKDFYILNSDYISDINNTFRNNLNIQESLLLYNSVSLIAYIPFEMYQFSLFNIYHNSDIIYNYDTAIKPYVNYYDSSISYALIPNYKYELYENNYKYKKSK